MTHIIIAMIKTARIDKEIKILILVLRGRRTKCLQSGQLIRVPRNLLESSKEWPQFEQIILILAMGLYLARGRSYAEECQLPCERGN